MLDKGFTVVLVGKTVIEKERGVPVHPLAEGVTVTVAVTVEEEPLTAVKPLIFPEPEVPKPTLAVLVHVKEAPGVGLLKLIPAAPDPLQRFTLEIELTTAPA
jgi:hypothetical protein